MWGVEAKTRMQSVCVRNHAFQHGFFSVSISMSSSMKLDMFQNIGKYAMYIYLDFKIHNIPWNVISCKTGLALSFLKVVWFLKVMWLNSLLNY